MNNSEMAEIKDMFQQTNGLVLQLSKDVNYMRAN